MDTPNTSLKLWWSPLQNTFSSEVELPSGMGWYRTCMFVGRQDTTDIKHIVVVQPRALCTSSVPVLYQISSFHSLFAALIAHFSALVWIGELQTRELHPHCERNLMVPVIFLKSKIDFSSFLASGGCPGGLWEVPTLPSSFNLPSKHLWTKNVKFGALNFEV